MKKFLAGTMFTICLGLGAQAQQITGSTKLTVASTQSSSQGLLSGCTYIGSGGCSLPAGPSSRSKILNAVRHHMLVQPIHRRAPAPYRQTRTPPIPLPNTPNVFQTAQVHNGSNSFGGLYGGDGDQVNWILRGNVIGTFTTVYYSWWESTDPNAQYGNSDYFINNMNALDGVGTCGGSVTGNGFNAQDTQGAGAPPRSTSFIITGGNGPDGAGGTNLTCQGRSCIKAEPL